MDFLVLNYYFLIDFYMREVLKINSISKEVWKLKDNLKLLKVILVLSMLIEFNFFL